MLAIMHRKWGRYGWYLLGGVVLTATLSALILVLQPHVSQTPKPAPRAEHHSATVPQPIRITSRMLVTGNTFWGRYINDWAMASPLKQAYPFSRLHEFHRDQYDAWISGLECPTVPGLNISSATMDKTLEFNCDPSYLAEAAKWFTAFTLANNHTDNQGAGGFATTRQQLDAHHIQYFGHYDPRAIDDICEIISLPVTTTQSNNQAKPGMLPVAMCGYHGVFRIPSDEAIAQIKRYSRTMPVLVFPHMGEEYKPAPDELKTRLYRAMIDAGADVVLGDHPHWIQSTESYKGHLIVYSMGNFMFDQQNGTEVTRSAAIRITLATDTTPVESIQLQKWLALGEKCATYHDACLDLIQSEKLNKLPLAMRFGVIGTNDSGKITKPATEPQTKSILDRLNWQQTVSQLGAPYGGL